MKTFIYVFFLEWDIFHTKVVEKIKIHFYVQIFHFTENRALYETKLKIIVEPNRPQMPMKLDACAMHAVYNYATNTHSECETLFAVSTAKMDMQKGPNIKLDLHRLSVVYRFILRKGVLNHLNSLCLYKFARLIWMVHSQFISIPHIPLCLFLLFPVFLLTLVGYFESTLLFLFFIVCFSPVTFPVRIGHKPEAIL